MLMRPTLNLAPSRPGAVGALMDEYERAIRDLTRVVVGLNQAEFDCLRDAGTTDEDCRSIATVVRHVLRSGKGYARYLGDALGFVPAFTDAAVANPTEAVEQLEGLAHHTATALEGQWHLPDQVLAGVRIQSRWGPVFDGEQMFEHAIVHVLRHRRQIERFLQRVAEMDSQESPGQFRS